MSGDVVRIAATVCVFGLGTFVISVLAEDRTQGRQAIKNAVVGASLLSAAGAGIGATVEYIASPTLRNAVNDGPKLAIFIALAITSTVCLVVDDGCVGLLRGGLQLSRNAVFATSKLALALVFALLVTHRLGVQLSGAWLAGTVLSLVTVTRGLAVATKGQHSSISLRYLMKRRSLIMSHHWLNVSITAPRLLLPVLVAGLLGAESNAAYYLAAVVVGIIGLIPFHLSTALFALAPGDKAVLQLEIRLTMTISVALAIISAPVFLLGAPFILSVFGSTYRIAGTAMGVLGLTTLPSAVKDHYIAVSRVRGVMQRAALLTTVGAVFEVSFGILGALLDGISGVAIGWLLALTVEAGLFFPTVFSALAAREMRWLDAYYEALKVAISPLQRTR